MVCLKLTENYRTLAECFFGDDTTSSGLNPAVKNSTFTKDYAIHDLEPSLTFQNNHGILLAVNLDIQTGIMQLEVSVATTTLLQNGEELASPNLRRIMVECQTFSL